MNWPCSSARWVISMGRGLLGCTCLTKHFNHLATKKKWSAKQSKSDLYTSLYILFGVVSFPHFPSSMQTAERWVHKLRTQRAGDESWTWGCKNPMKPLKFSIKIQIREPFNPIFKQKLRNYMKLHETTWKDQCAVTPNAKNSLRSLGALWNYTWLRFLWRGTGEPNHWIKPWFTATVDTQAPGRSKNSPQWTVASPSM